MYYKYAKYRKSSEMAKNGVFLRSFKIQAK